MLAAPCVFVCHVGVEILEDFADAAGEIGVLQTDAQFVVGNFAEDGDGVVVKVLPAARRQLGEEFLGALVPGPPEIVGQAVEAGDNFGCFFGR